MRQKKSLGQVFLKDPHILQKTLQVVQLEKAASLVEIGCGDGALTAILSAQNLPLHVFEIDERCIHETQQRLGQLSHVTYHLGDVLKQPTLLADGVPSPLCVVANIPYYISAPILKLLCRHHSVLSQAVLLVQLEFAQKIRALPGHELYTSFSVYCRFFFESKLAFKVSKGCFYPVPKVDSAVLVMTPVQSLPLPPEDWSGFFAMVRSAFWARRKTLQNYLKNSPYLSIDPAFFLTPPFDLSKRGETLDLSQFLMLYSFLKKYIKDIFIHEYDSQ